MAHEVDILAVGDNSQSGDAIALRFGDFVNNPNDQRIVVIDGGFKESGEKLVELIRQTYNTDYVDLVISTHPDNDHVSGLHVVLEELKVGELWLHRPWLRSESIKTRVKNRVTTVLGLASKLEKSLESAYDLEQLAIKKNIKIIDPFQGLSAFDNKLHVLGPSEEFYLEQVANFEKSSSYSLVEKTKRMIEEFWHQDELADPEEGATSSRNNSSVVLLAQLGDDTFLFTGDAGVSALHHAADYADLNNFDIASNVQYQQVPHHGSKRNLGPEILNRIIGPKVAEGIIHPAGKTAFISAAALSTKHPSQRVINALTTRGVKVAATQGQNQCFRSLDVPVRPGWVPIVHLEFAARYEEEN